MDLPDEPVICILKHLALDDVKSCRLVCQQWHECSLVNDVADKFQLTFRSHVKTTEEMNTFLISIQRARLNVEFIGVQLKELNFEAFGPKLKDLVITKCFADDEATIKDVVKCLREIRRLHIGPQSGAAVAMWGRAFADLLREEFRNDKLKSFHCHWDNIELADLNRMFPQLREIVCSRLNITGETQLPILAGLTALTAHIDLHIRGDSPVSTTSAFLQFCSGLEHLKSITTVINLIFRSPAPDEKFFHRDASLKFFSRDVIFCLLEKCNELRTVSVFVRGTDRCVIPSRELKACSVWLRPNDYLKFVRLVSKVENLCMGEIVGIRVPKADFQAALIAHDSGIVIEKLESLALSNTAAAAPDDFRPTMLELCTNLKVLDLRVDVFQLNLTNFEGNLLIPSINLADIIQSKKNLRTLYLTITANKRASLYKVDLESYKTTCSFVTQHEKLHHLKVHFTSFSIHHLTDPNSPFGTLWNFPNLQSLHISCPLAPMTLSEFRRNILRWIRMMPASLQKIDLPRQLFTRMSIEEITSICMAQEKLIHITWASSNYLYLDEARIVELYAQHCPKLRTVQISGFRSDVNRRSTWDTIEYHYCRSEQVLYKYSRQLLLRQYKIPSQFSLP